MGIEWDNEGASSGGIKWDDEDAGKKVASSLVDNVLEGGKVAANLATGLGSSFFGVGAAARAGNLDAFKEGAEAFQDATHLDYADPKGKAAKAEQKAMEALDWFTQTAGTASVLARDALGTVIPGIHGRAIKAVPEEMVRGAGEVASNFIPLERGLAVAGKLGKGFRRSGILSPAELKALQDIHGGNTPFPTLNESAPPMEPGLTTTNVEQPFPQLNERVPTLPETPVEGSTAFPLLDGVEPTVKPLDGISIDRGVQPAPEPPKGLELVPSDPYKPFKGEETPPAILPETTLLDALLEKSGERGAKTPETPLPTIDFPLRQEVLETPAIKKAIEDFRREADLHKDNPEALAQTQVRFLEGMKMLGIESPQDAFGRALYDQGRTSLPIEKTKTLAEQAKAHEMDPWSDFARTDKLPPEPLGNRNGQGRYVPKSQRGSIDPSVILDLIPKLRDTMVKTLDGLPKLMYHGTSKDVPFKDIKPNSRGAWFTEHPKDASGYALDNDSQGWRHVSGHTFERTNTASRVYPVYLDIKNPKILTRAENQKFHNSYGGNYAKSQREYIARARREGFDGLVSEDGKEAVAFDKSQIHSALSPKIDRPLGQTKKGFSQRGAVDPSAVLDGVTKLLGFRPKNLFQAKTLLEARLNRAMDTRDTVMAQAYKEKLNELASFGDRPLGQTDRGASQRGGAKMDENFIKFRNKLPANMQKDARRLYRAFQKMQEGKPLEITPGSSVEKAIVRIPGMEGILEDVAPIAEKSVDEMLPIIKASPDTSMSAIGKLLRSGADLTGFETKNPLIRYLGDVVNNAYRRGEAFRKQLILDDKSGVLPKFNALSPKEQVAVHEAMRAVEGKTDLPDTSLLNDKQKAFIEAYRKADDQALLSINEGRAAHELKPLAKRMGHMASRWHGDFLVPVFDKEGNMVTAITTRTKWGAKKAANWMAENHPDYKVGEVSARSLGKRSADAEAGFAEVMRLLEDDDPAISAIQDAYAKFLEDEAYNYNNVKKHFQSKRDKPMQGFEGGKEWLSPEKNAKEAIQSSIKYMEQAYRWSEIQKAGAKVSKLLSDEDLQGRNDRSYADAYWKRASGQGTAFDHAMNQVVNSIGDVTWVGGSNIRQAGRILKGALTLKFLGFTNLAYGASQVWQPLQMMPHWMTYLKQKGAKADISISSAKATWDVHAPRDQMSDFGREAFDWAEKNGIADSHIIEEVRDASVSGKFADIADHAIRWAPSKLETYSRYTAFMNYAHFLKDSGITTKAALESAAKITDMSMTNYHIHERPLLYRNLGFVGDMASALTTFKHNQYHQLKSFGVEGRRINLMPMIAAQLFAGGMLGFYGRDEVDSVIKDLNSFGSWSGMWDGYIPTTKEYLLKNAPDWVSFGGVSKATGLDLSSKFSAADVLPNGISEMVFPFWGEIKNIAESAQDLASRRSGEALKKFIHVNSPTALKFLTEDENAQGVTIDPKTDEGMYKRDTWDKVARKIGAYSVDESKERMATQELKNQSQWQKNLANHLLQKAKDSEGGDLQDAAVRYVKMGGDVQSLINTLTAHKRAQVVTAFQREAGLQANTTMQRQRLMRALEYGK